MNARSTKTTVIPALCGDPEGRPAVLLSFYCNKKHYKTRRRATGSPHKAGMTIGGDS